LDLLRTLAADQHPRVRLEAVRAASFFTVPEAVEVALISNDYPTDRYLDFVRGETMRALEPIVRKAAAECRRIAFIGDAGARYFLQNGRTDDLLKMERNRGVCLELLLRKNLRDEQRKEALASLAKLDRKSELQVLLDTIHGQDLGVKSQSATE